jgi:hypothetical protein
MHGIAPTLRGKKAVPAMRQKSSTRNAAKKQNPQCGKKAARVMRQ